MLPRIPSTITSRCSYIFPSSVLLSWASESTTAAPLLPLIRHRRHRSTRRPNLDEKLFSSSSSSSSASANNDNFNSIVIDQIKTFSIGAVAGVLGSLAGMGGGFVMIPMMTAATSSSSAAARTKIAIPTASPSHYWFDGLRGGLGLNQHQAHGTSLFAVGTTGLAGALGYGIHLSSSGERDEGDDGNENRRRCDGDITITTATRVDVTLSLMQSHATSQQLSHIQQRPQSQQPAKNEKGLVELDIALALATTAMVTARLGAIASSSLSERVLQRALGAFMICVAPLVTGKTYFEEWYAVVQQEANDDNVVNSKRDDEDVAKKIHLNENDNDTNTNSNTLQHQIIDRLLPASFIGMFSGFLSGIFGVGGGSIVVPSLVLTTNMSYHSALGTSLCAMVLPAMVGTFTHSKRGNVNWRIAPMLAIGSAVGAYFGGREIGLNVDEGVLRVGFSCLMLVLGVRTWRKGSR